MNGAPARRPRRALLFVPGNDRKKIEKAAALSADGVILDLEDSVAPAKKAEARPIALRSLAEVEFGKAERLLRINALDLDLAREDLRALEGAAKLPDAIVAPKVESAESLAALARSLLEIERGRALPPGTVRVLAIIETARGVVRLREIAGAQGRLEALIFGAEDLCGDMGMQRTLEGREVFYARSAVVLHAASERLQAIDTPFIALDDEPGLLADTRAALELGYAGKLAIHPKQLAPIVSVFTPSPEEIAAAQKLLEAHARQEAEGRGVFQLDGKMVDMPMVRAAERVIARARAAGIPT